MGASMWRTPGMVESARSKALACSERLPAPGVRVQRVAPRPGSCLIILEGWWSVSLEKWFSATGAVSGNSMSVGEVEPLRLTADEGHTDLEGVADIALDTAGNLYVAEQDARRIRRIDPAGRITPFAGTGLPGQGRRWWACDRRRARLSSQRGGGFACERLRSGSGRPPRSED